MKKFSFKVEKKDSDLVIISNDIVKARYKLSISSQKLLLYLISHITYEERKEGKFLNELKFNLKEILLFYKSAGVNSFKDLKEKLKLSIKEIEKNPIAISFINKKGEEHYKNHPWYSTIEFNESRNIFIFSFNQKIANLLLNIKNYFKSNLKEYLHLKSSYAIDLYMLFRANEFKKPQQTYSIKELKSILSIEENYERWDLLKRRVIDPAIEQLNQNTNYIFSYTAERESRKIEFIIFSIINKENAQNLKKFLIPIIESYLKVNKLEKMFISFPFADNMNFFYNSSENLCIIEISSKEIHLKSQPYIQKLISEVLIERPSKWKDEVSKKQQIKDQAPLKRFFRKETTFEIHFKN